MNKPTTIATVRAKINVAVKHATARYNIVAGECYDWSSNCMCPMTAVMLDHGRLKSKIVSINECCETAAELLNIKSTDVEAFMCGFDGKSEPQTFHNYTGVWINGSTRLCAADERSARRYHKLGHDMANDFRAKCIL